MNTETQMMSLPLTRPGRAKIGRNDRCPCGSGLKWKKCHGGPEAEMLGNLQAMYRRAGMRILTSVGRAKS